MNVTPKIGNQPPIHIITDEESTMTWLWTWSPTHTAVRKNQNTQSKKPIVMIISRLMDFYFLSDPSKLEMVLDLFGDADNFK